jgi:hypothetical protein
MTARAKRRRDARQLGRRRADGKHGRRDPVRAPAGIADVQALTRLAGAGFVIARPRLVLPGDAQTRPDGLYGSEVQTGRVRPSARHLSGGERPS